MKPQQFSGEGSLGAESKRTFREKLRQACEAALGSKAHNNQNDLLISKEIERRRWVKNNYRAEDPIRTMMFLGSWSHT